LSILFALGTITKVSGATLVPVIGLALLIRGLRNNEWKSVLITGGSITAAWLAVGSWWYIRNLVLYNEFFGTRTHVAIIGGREVSFFEVLSQEWYGFWVAYWAWFGAVNILADDWVYFLFGVITCAAIIGTVAWLLRQILVREWGTLIVPGVLLTQIVIILGAVIRWTMITYGSQGRLIFPAFAALCSLGAYGLLYWLPTKIQRPVAISLTTLLMGIAVISPFLYIAPVYVPGPTVNELPQAARPANAVWGPLELVGVEISESGFTVGDYLPVTTYWRLNDTTDLDYSTSYTLYGSDETQVGKLDSYPGLGTWPTTRMTAGMIVRDDSLVQIKGPLSAPSQIRVQIGVGLIEGDRYLILPPLDTAGIPRDVAIFDAGPAYPAQGKGCQAELPPNVESSSFVDFARIRFRELPEKAEPGTDVKVSAVWDTYANPGIEYTAFIHLVSFTGEVIAQGDEPPLNGDYPSNLWYRPCRFDDTFSVELPSDLPPGNYSILFGLYDPADPALARVPVINSDGSPYPDYAIQVGTIAVSAH
jgi:hypothetical protein